MRKLAVICLSIMCFCLGAIAQADENTDRLRALFKKGAGPTEDQLKLHQKWSCTDGVFYIFEASPALGWIVARMNVGHANFLQKFNGLQQMVLKRSDFVHFVRVSEATGDLIIEQALPNEPLYQTHPASVAEPHLKSVGYLECPARMASPISKEAVAVMRAYLPLSGPTVAISEREVAAYQQQLLRGQANVSFERAFTAGLNSWLQDDRDSESLMGLIRAQKQETGEPVVLTPGNPQNLARLENRLDEEFSAIYRLRNRYLDHSTTVLTLQPLEEAAPHGEQPSANWVFSLSVGELSDHQFFAVVDPRDPQKVYNYGFN